MVPPTAWAAASRTALKVHGLHAQMQTCFFKTQSPPAVPAIKKLGSGYPRAASPPKHAFPKNCRPSPASGLSHGDHKKAFFVPPGPATDVPTFGSLGLKTGSAATATSEGCLGLWVTWPLEGAQGSPKEEKAAGLGGQNKHQPEQEERDVHPAEAGEVPKPFKETAKVNSGPRLHQPEF